MARPEGLEPPTPCLEGRRSFQLSYGRLIDSKRFPSPRTIICCASRNEALAVLCLSVMSLDSGLCSAVAEPCKTRFLKCRELGLTCVNFRG